MTTTQTDLDLLTLREVAAILRCSMTTVYALAANGQVPAVKVGGRWRVPREALYRQLEASP